MRMTPRPREGDGAGETLWEVGSASDDGEDDSEVKGKGVGVRGASGERGGLLEQEDEDELELEEGEKKDEEFGEFERAQR